MKKIYLLAALLTLASTGNAYRRTDFAICFIGGLNSLYGQPNSIACAIRDTHPDIPFVELKIGDGSQAATRVGMYHQVGQICSFALNTPSLAGKHVILICGSQGGLVGQAFIEMYGDKLPFTIDSFMTCASPLGGQYGLPDGWENDVDKIISQSGLTTLQQIAGLLGIKEYPMITSRKKTITIGMALAQLEEMKRAEDARDVLAPIRAVIAKLVKAFVRKDFSLIRFVFYNPIGQDLISVAGYWRDPKHRLDYLSFNGFLPYINNEREHVNAARYKANMSALNWAIFLWAGKDNTVKPPCSGSKCFYKWGSTTDLESGFKDTMQYQQDLLGLGTMFNEGRLLIEELPNDTHAFNSAEAIAAGLRYFDMIVNDPIPK